MEKIENPEITETTQTEQISPEVSLFDKPLEGPRRSGRTAIYVHGGGGGGNHSLLVRPCRKLIDEGYFDRIECRWSIQDRTARLPALYPHAAQDAQRMLAVLAGQQRGVLAM